MSQLAPAFRNPVYASQAVFRSSMNAMARPGVPSKLSSQVVAPGPLCSAAAAVALTLLDFESPVWLDETILAQPEAVEWLRFHTGAPITADPKSAAFAFIVNPLCALRLDAFALGTLEYPDRSTTIVLQVEEFSGQTLWFSGPGIPQKRSFSASPLPPDFRAQLTANHQLFPCGVDLLITCDDALIAIPRSVSVIEQGS
jgi:alpha-D-ribose 1-methylphosphonate 5-triphosphate synthase subunit PhnH